MYVRGGSRSCDEWSGACTSGEEVGVVTNVAGRVCCTAVVELVFLVLCFLSFSSCGRSQMQDFASCGSSWFVNRAQLSWRVKISKNSAIVLVVIESSCLQIRDNGLQFQLFVESQRRRVTRGRAKEQEETDLFPSASDTAFLRKQSWTLRICNSS